MSKKISKIYKKTQCLSFYRWGPWCVRIFLLCVLLLKMHDPHKQIKRNQKWLIYQGYHFGHTHILSPNFSIPVKFKRSCSIINKKTTKVKAFLYWRNLLKDTIQPLSVKVLRGSIHKKFLSISVVKVIPMLSCQIRSIFYHKNKKNFLLTKSAKESQVDLLDCACLHSHRSG